MPFNVPYNRDLVITLLHKELKLRYKSSFLGYFWSLLNPLSKALIFFYAFQLILNIKQYAYALFLISALFPWTWISNGIMASTNAFLGNGSLIKKVTFPRWLLVIVVVLNEGVHFLITIPVLVAFMWHYGQYPTWTWVWEVPLLWLTTGIMISGLALIVATANLFFRDLERIVEILLLIIMYLTPIMFPAKLIEAAGYSWTFNYNPIAWIILSWRSLFFQDPSQTVTVDYLGRAVVGALVSFVIGYSVYRWKVWRFAEIV